MYRPVDPQQSFPDLELAVLERWRERDVFAASLRPPRRRRAVGLLRGTADRQRPPGRPPRARAGLQGHLSPLQDDARLPGRAQGRLGLPRPAGRDRRREGARPRVEGRDRGLRDRRLQQALPGVGLRVPRGLEPPDRADRLLDRPRRRLPDARRLLRRVGLVGARADPREGPPLRGSQGRPVLPALRHGPLVARGRPRLPRRRGPVGLRADGRRRRFRTARTPATSC